MSWCNPSYTIISLDFAHGYLRFIAVYFVSLFLWGFYRYHHNLKVEAKVCSLSPGKEGLIGFRNSIVGTSLRYVYLALILLSQIFLCIVVWNVVCATSLEVQPYWNTRAKTYIIFYVSGLVMCLILHFLEPFFETFFYLRESLDKCTYVKSKKKQNLIQILKNTFNQAFQKEPSNIQLGTAGLVLPLLKVQKRADNTRFICHNQVTYTYLESESGFVCCDQSSLYELLGKKELLKNGLSSEEANKLLNVFGKNTIDLEIPGILQAFGKELLNPVNILRLGSLWQGIFLRFYIWSVLWAIMILLTTFKTLQVIILNQENIKKALENYIGRPISVLRNGKKVRIPSHELVPGDLIFLSQDLTAPCDIYLVSGCVTVNESFITGESNPIIKLQIDRNFFSSIANDQSNSQNRKFTESELSNRACSTLDSINLDHFETDSKEESHNISIHDSQSITEEKLRQKSIFMGTKIISSLSYDDSSKIAMGVAFRTGIYSSYGQLLYKSVHSFSNISQYSLSNVKYIRNLKGLWLIMLLSAFVAILYQNHLLGWSTGSFFFAVGTFIQLLPLWAPTCIQFSLNKSVERLEKLCSLSSTFPMDIPLAGKLKVLCLDKTGTLTTNKMAFIGIINTIKNNNNFGYPNNKAYLLENSNPNVNPELQKSKESKNSVTFEQNRNSFNIFVHYELAWETSTISYEEEDPLINKSAGMLIHPHCLEPQLLPPITDLNSLSSDDLSYIGLCCCHNIVPQVTNNGVILIGNDIDKALFTSTNAKIKICNERRFISLTGRDTKDSGSVDNIYEYPIEVLRINEFDWNNPCMSVVVHHRILDRYYIFCKGSFDVLANLSPKKEEIATEKHKFINTSNNWDTEDDQELVDAFEVLNSSSEIDSDLLNKFTYLKSTNAQRPSHQMNEHSIVDAYSKLGYYIMGMSFREIKDKVLIDALLNKPRSNVSRNTLESDLIIISYILLQNDLRPKTREFVDAIKMSGIKPIILTGDSAFTALSVARKAGIISNKSPVAIADTIMDLTGNETIVWYDAITGSNMIISPNKIYESTEYSSLVVTSRALMLLRSKKYFRPSNFEIVNMNPSLNFSFLKTYCKFDKLSSEELSSHSLLDLVFDRIKIFARSNPEHKRIVISEFKKRNIITGMIGDGVNDLPAFKMADVSISVHENSYYFNNFINKDDDHTQEDYNNNKNFNTTTENSPMTLAFSSFSIEADKIMKVLDLIREGRAAMVTTISLFMFLLSQGVFYSFYKNVLFAIAQANLPVMSYVFIDVILVFPSIWLMILCKPKKYINSNRPTGALLGKRTVLSFISLLGTCFAFYYIVMTRLFSAPWMIPSLKHNAEIPVERWFQRQDNFEASTTFIWMGLQLSSLSLILSFGGQFRESFTKNKRLLSWVAFCHAFLLYLCLSSPNALTCLFRVNCTDQIDRFWKFEIFGFNIFTITGGRFQGVGSHNVFPLIWKVEFIFWNYFSIFFMSLIYWWITSNSNFKKVKFNVY
ncbi:P-type ATPase cation transport protein [Cryptosporidium ubiquitum]|uniref:P-type ATPase cation transport protein n=1 Tax=Cryptosporidium ubiquitum TaxID=857276 RepID=A0A1J4MEY8_9CRYT|nr:P-type ATPase cation transport protein [Cryptosporidium ubiquitum]OII71421.1 P-type ATPase cation transport protein [Cryptosporidium ubiquitum]